MESTRSYYGDGVVFARTCYQTWVNSSKQEQAGKHKPIVWFTEFYFYPVAHSQLEDSYRLAPNYLEANIDSQSESFLVQ